MTTEFIHDRGRGPEIIGSRVTVYHLLPYFLDPTATEDFICRTCDLTPQEVAAARAYTLNNPDTIIAQHLKIEARMAAGNPPDVVEQAHRTHSTFQTFKAYLSKRRQATGQGSSGSSAAHSGGSGPPSFPTFREWLAEQSSQTAEGP